MGMVNNTDSRSAIGWLHCTPANPNSCGKMKMAGRKKIPCREAASTEARPARPMVCNIMLLKVKNPKSGEEDTLQPQRLCADCSNLQGFGVFAGHENLHDSRREARSQDGKCRQHHVETLKLSQNAPRTRS